MKIVSWNCNGKFREKFKEILKLNADILVIEECEDPIQTKNEEYKKFASNYIWLGYDKNKGIGIFAKDNIKIVDNNWNTYGLMYFLSVKINDCFDLIGVWAKGSYIEEYYVYHQIYSEKYNEKTVLIGDFNSNSIWDCKHKYRNHTKVIEEFEKINIYSVYHFLNNECHGNETLKTFFTYRKKENGYHIDYCFTNKDNIKNFYIENVENWLKFSDHIPIVFEYNEGLRIIS